ncbi:MAG: methyltransferase domain-containing protein [Gammaproteobacteria bacterium]|nr:methyltransferase domain-containing protein [Gammaproteobacteria bacterium]
MDSQWGKSRQAKHLWEVEREVLDSSVPNLYGHYLFQYSDFKPLHFESTSLKYHYYGSENQNDQLVIDYEALPFRDNSLDCVVLHHILDGRKGAHQCLREAARVVVPNGYLILVGFNPYSSWGGSRLLGRYSFAPKGHYLARSRAVDWLALLGFRIEADVSLQYMPPVILKYFPRFSRLCDKVLSYLGLPCAGVYVLLARKLVAGRTPIRPQWRALSGRRIPVATPSTRGIGVTGR